MSDELVCPAPEHYFEVRFGYRYFKKPHARLFCIKKIAVPDTLCRRSTAIEEVTFENSTIERSKLCSDCATVAREQKIGTNKEHER